MRYLKALFSQLSVLWLGLGFVSLSLIGVSGIYLDALTPDWQVATKSLEQIFTR